MTCHRCHRPIAGEHPCIERGVRLPDGTVIAADQDYCTDACRDADILATTKETRP